MKKRGVRNLSLSINYFFLTLPKSKRSQVTIFIIAALVIIGAAILIYFLSRVPVLKKEFDEKNPQLSIASCLDEEIENTLKSVSLQGGSINPELYIEYQGNRIEYLCYNVENHANCVVQRPLLKEHTESEIKKNIEDDVASCFNNLKQSYEDRGYEVDLQSGGTVVAVELLPKRVVLRPDYILTVTKGNTQRFDNFDIVLNNNLYELITIASSIVNFEAALGDAETTIYMNYYRDLKVEKKNQQDGSTIYILTDRNTGNKFQFASRSVAWPPGI